ncbi:hypothetical protein ACFL9U_13520 [Thermodesulfobacteriota bacterium]
MKVRKTTLKSISIAVAFLAVFFCTTPAIGMETSVSSYDFGEVLVGESKTINIDLTNTDGRNNLVIDRIGFENNSCGFSTIFTGLTIAAGATQSIPIEFTPVRAGECMDTLRLDYLSQTTFISIKGTGIEQETVETTEIKREEAPPPPSLITIGDCETGIADIAYKGQLISDWIDSCAGSAKNHGKFVSCMSDLANKMKKDGAISSDEKKMLKTCAAKADIP